MATTTTSTRRSKHVVLFPFPGQGHLASFLAMARLLARELPPDASTITLVSTPRNVAAMRSSSFSSSSVAQPQARPPAVAFHALPFVPSDHGLPAGCESTASLPLPSFITLFEAIESLEPALDDYVSRLLLRGGGDDEDPADVCIVADVLLAWTVRVARRHGCAHVLFVTCGAFGTAIFHALWAHMPALPFGNPGGSDGSDADDVLRLPEYPDVEIHRSQLSPVFLLRHSSSSNSDIDLSERWTAYYHRAIRQGHGTDAVLVNTVEELEATGLAMMRRAAGENKVPVWPIGPLVRGATDAGDDVILRWLDTHRPSSVLYISFGSQNSIRADQMSELAAALESTRRPFVWAVRPPPVGSSAADWLPEGFEARARGEGRGLVVRGWVPQVRVLAHASTGAFLSHCGWNSALESLAHGVPLLGWPLSAEQFYNARMLAEEWGVCVEVARGNLESSPAVERCQVAQALETVMAGDTGEAADMRRRVKEVQEMLKSAWRQDGGSSATALHEFFGAMRLK